MAQKWSFAPWDLISCYNFDYEKGLSYNQLYCYDHGVLNKGDGTSVCKVAIIGKAEKESSNVLRDRGGNGLMPEKELLFSIVPTSIIFWLFFFTPHTSFYLSVSCIPPTKLQFAVLQLLGVFFMFLSVGNTAHNHL